MVFLSYDGVFWLTVRIVKMSGFFFYGKVIDISNEFKTFLQLLVTKDITIHMLVCYTF